MQQFLYQNSAQLLSPITSKCAVGAQSISCVLPAYNEVRNLAPVVLKVLSTTLDLSKNIEIIVVDDGSNDGTALLMVALCAAHPQIVYLQLSRNFGKEAALTAGLDVAQGDVVVLMDADGQHPPALLKSMLLKYLHSFQIGKS